MIFEYISEFFTLIGYFFVGYLIGKLVESLIKKRKIGDDIKKKS